MAKGSWPQGHDVEQHSRAELQLHIIQVYSSCVQWTIAGSEALPRSRAGHQTNRSTALSTVSHGPSRYPIVRDLVVPPTVSSRFVAGELEKSGRNLEQIGAKFLGPNRFGLFFKKHAYIFREYWKLEPNLDSFKTPLSSRFSLNAEKKRGGADAGGRTRLARPISRARPWVGEKSFSQFRWQRYTFMKAGVGLF